MYHRLTFVLMLLVLLSNVSPATPQRADAAPQTAPSTSSSAVANSTGSAPPALPRSCGGTGTPIDYDQEVCCVSGYVYLNGAPTLGAEVTVSVNGRTAAPVQTQASDRSTYPSYAISLNAEPLNVQPGDTVSVTASAGGQRKTVTFVAQAGGQQVDVVLPQSAVDATWGLGEKTITARSSQGMVYDEARQRVVVFGGISATGPLSDTWEWDGLSWLRRRPRTFPSIRAGYAMVYDAARHRTLLFGGNTGGNLANDTWEWDGSTWTLRTPIISPLARQNTAMVYDEDRQRVVLFGGQTSLANGRSADTWEWNGMTWIEMHPSTSPPSRAGHVMSYDITRHRTVLFGGDHYNDTWEWDGVNWTRRYPTASPPPRYLAAMVYDKERHVSVLIGGEDTQPMNDSWEWDGNSWTQMYLPLTARFQHRMVYDTTRQSIILFGGQTFDIYGRISYFGETLERDGSYWSQRSPKISPAGRLDHAMTYDIARQRVVLFGGYGGYNNSTDTWEWDGISWSERKSIISPPSLRRHQLVYDEAHKRAVLFGGMGLDGTANYNDTWEWDGINWVKDTPTVSPPARHDHVMIYDPVRKKVILFGGIACQVINNAWNCQRYNDTWEWDGTTWIQKTPSLSPSLDSQYLQMWYDADQQQVVLFLYNSNGYPEIWAWNGDNWNKRSFTGSPGFLADSRIVYDAVRHRAVLFGGSLNNDLSQFPNDTWEYDGIKWTKHLSLRKPPGRYEHALIYDVAHQQVLLFSGTKNAYPYFKDTWKWDGVNWTQIPDDSNIPDKRGNAALSYEHDSTTLLFGGQLSTNEFDSNTYRWQGNQWQMLTPTNSPSGRIGHRIARNADGSTLLLFGGKDSGGAYLDDTWAWDGDDWAQQTPAARPSARGYYSLTYDMRRQVWVLFGGQDSTRYLGDTWEYDGSTWTQRTTATSPPARGHATLTYDAVRGRAVLIGGQNVDGLLDDVWEYDGTDWRNATPAQRLQARTDHGAAFDSVNGVTVVAAGLSASGVLSDTWEWNGSFWTQRNVQTSLPAMSGFGMDYDGERGEMVVFGGQNGTGYVSGTYLHQVLGAVSNPLPVATINRVNPRDARQEIDTLTLDGTGADADSTDVIAAYRWTLNGQVIGTQPTLTLPASALPLGEQIVSFAVQDNEGAWSPVVEQHLFIRDKNGSIATGKTWTLLIYAVADNDLDLWLGDHAASNGMLARLRTAGAQPNVQVGILYDGPRSNDTRRYILDAQGRWTMEPLSEARMDDMATLRDFVVWGRASFHTDYYALALADHANGIVGFGQDLTSNTSGSAFLTPSALRTALQAATDDGAHKLDVLQYDGCSFGLFEDAAIADGLAQYVVASPNTGWGIFAYDRYRQLAGRGVDPRTYAHDLAQTYAATVASYQLPYTIAAYDMAQFTDLYTTLGVLGNQLTTYVQADPVSRIPQLKGIRAKTQRYDSGGQYQLQIDQEDSYVDVTDLAEQLRANLADAAIQHAANDVTAHTAAFTLYESHASGRFVDTTGRLIAVDLGHAHGLGIYYPPRIATAGTSAYVAYVQNRLFDITRAWGWTTFLAQALPALSAGDPESMANDTLIAPLLPADVAPDLTPQPMVTPEQGGVLHVGDGDLQVDLQVPAAAVSNPMVLTYTRALTPSHALPPGTTAVQTFAVEARTPQGQRITRTQLPYTLTLTYTDALLAAQNLSEASLNVLAWNGTAWVPLLPCANCQIDTAANRISLQVDQFTEFALVSSPPPSASQVTSITPEAGGTLHIQDGAVQIDLIIPPEAVTSAMIVTYTHQLAALPNDTALVALHSFALEARTLSGQRVYRTQLPYTIVLHFASTPLRTRVATAEDIGAPLNLLGWNGKQWAPLLPCAGCSSDSIAQRVTLQTDQFTSFVLATTVRQQTFLPMIGR